MYKEKTLNKTLSMFTVPERNLRHAFQNTLTDFISHMLQWAFKKMEELNSELHCRVYYC